ncbi:Ig-like domain-containing protein, partial [Bradyrhizobium sp. RD5-C2]|uniref:Ig-like domain-containing protein n=1 Tax=Bradyrhizobium sp. RD5-C2 TaxID=244562 RepID=UPI001CC64799
MNETVTYLGSGLVFNNTYGAGVTPAYRSAIITAENYFQSHFNNSVVLNMSFDLTPLDVKFAGQNNYNPVHVDFFTLVSALRAKATSPDDVAAANYLGLKTDPSHGAGFDVSVGMARILGLASAGTGIDDAIVLNSNLYWSYGSDTVGVLEHEISEGAMGRIGGLGIQNDAWGPMDLFRSTLQIGATIPAYFTFGGAVFTDYEFHNVSNGQDFGDWDHTVGDAFGPYNAGIPASLSDVDLQIMDLLGWTRFYAPTPTGLALSPATDSGIKGDGNTNQAKQVITGTGEAGDTVILSDSWSGPVVTGGGPAPSTAIGSAVVDSSGTWSISVSLPVGGVHTLTATESDALHGGSLPSSPFLVSVVQAAPLPTLTNLALFAASDTGVVGDNATYVTTPVIVGNGGSFGQIVTLYDNGVAVGTGTVGFVSTWSVTSGPLSIGTHKLTASVDDGAGDVSAPSASLTVSIVPSPAPVVTPMNADLSATHHQSFTASSLFSASDPNGDAITTYAFWDIGTGGAHFLLSGVAQGTNQEIDVTAAQLSQVSYQSGSGVDTLWVRANDGTQWGSWSPSFNITAPTDHSPNVGAPDFAASHNQNIAISTLFSVSDADGDSMTAYLFWDSTTDPASGHFVVGGVVQGTNQNIDITAAQLAGTTFQSGSGSDDVW